MYYRDCDLFFSSIERKDADDALGTVVGGGVAQVRLEEETYKYSSSIR